MTDITLNTVDKSVIGKFNTMLDKYAKDKNSFVEIKEVIKKIGKRIKIHVIPLPIETKNNLRN